MLRRLTLCAALLAGCELNTLNLGGQADSSSRADGSVPPMDASVSDSEARVDDARVDGPPANEPDGRASDSGPMSMDGAAQRPSAVRTLATGGAFTCVVRNDDAARCFGSNAFGELGVAPAETSHQCDSFPCDFYPRSSAGLVDISEIALGDAHGCIINNAGTTSCWGSNRVGELGRGTSDTDPHPSPMLLFALADSSDAISAGYHHTCMLREGNVYCWGLNHLGQLGQATTSTCAVTDAALRSELGLVGPSVPCSTEPLEVPGVSGAQALFAFADQTCALVSGSILRCWGANGESQLALPATRSVAPFEFVSQPFRALSLGGSHGCGTFGASERLRCWGSHARGQLGVGSASLSMCGSVPCTASPTALSELHTVRALSLGDSHSCAVLANATVKCWGSDDHEQLGNSGGSADDCDGASCSKVPVDAFGLDRVKLLRSGRAHTCALRDDDTVTCWGRNDRMQCNEANRADVTHPSMIYGLN